MRDIEEAPFNYRGGGGGRWGFFLNWTNYLFQLMSAIFYLFRTLPQAKYVCHFCRMYYSVAKLDFNYTLYSSINVEVCFPICSFTLLYRANHVKLSRNIYFKYTPAPPLGCWPPNVLITMTRTGTILVKRTLELD